MAKETCLSFITKSTSCLYDVDWSCSTIYHNSPSLAPSWSANKCYSFAIWQLRSSYLSTIKDGIGDRLINVNNSVLNTPGFRAAGWSTAATNGTSASSIKRTYSPPIPTTAAVSSEYYRLAVRDANAARDELQGLGLEEGEEEEGGMVTGKSNLDYTGRRNHPRGGKKKGRRDRHQHEQAQSSVVPEDDDSSDLSDDSDEESESLHRYVLRPPRSPHRIQLARLKAF